MKDFWLTLLTIVLLFVVMLFVASDVEVMWNGTPHHFHLKLMP